MIYAVNKRTKTHRIAKDARDSNMLHEVIIQADADGWVEWNGGECPLPGGHPVECLLRGHDNSYTINTKWASTQRWNPKSYYSDVIAYRPILNTEETEMKQDNADSHLVAGQEYEYSFAMFKNPVDADIRDAVKFIGMDGAQAVVRTSRGTLMHTSAGCLRAVRSDRDRWIESAMGAASCPDRAPLVRNYFESIYDAGLAKLPEQTK